jgi:hypothetical protein
LHDNISAEYIRSAMMNSPEMLRYSAKVGLKYGGLLQNSKVEDGVYFAASGLSLPFQYSSSSI